MRIVIEPLIILPKPVYSRLVIAFISLSSLLVIVVLVIGFEIDGNEETMFVGKGMILYNIAKSFFSTLSERATRIFDLSIFGADM